jgi:hypothetical protein
MGYSFCRFVCGTPNDQMGSVDFYDGEWQWPQGLAHYVEHHSIRLPDEFIDTMRSRSWQLPSERQPPCFKQQLTLRAVGYWQYCLAPALPDPRALVQAGCYGDELPWIVAYLRAGRCHTLDFMDALETGLIDWDDDLPNRITDKTFWTNWAQTHGAISQVSVSAEVRPEWLVRPGPLDELLAFFEMLLGGRFREKHGEQLRSQVNAALEPGRELWHWQNGNPDWERGASAGLAVLQDGEVLCEWWLHTGWLAEYWERRWIGYDGQVQQVVARR